MTLDRPGGAAASEIFPTPALFAAAPRPSRIGFVDLLADLVRGHVRRYALFEWRFAPRAPPLAGAPYAGLIKMDRTGGGQIPGLEEFAALTQEASPKRRLRTRPEAEGEEERRPKGEKAPSRSGPVSRDSRKRSAKKKAPR